MKINNNKNQIIIYRGKEGQPRLNVQTDGKTVWLTQKQLTELFKTSKTNVSEHIKNIFQEKELDKKATVRKFRTVQKEGTREVLREVEYYNLDLIISLGYRIKSSIATQFRMWATKRLKEYIIKGFALDDDKLKNGNSLYWQELLNRIKDIRSSEKVLYRQILDLYATSIDYDPNSKESQKFFAIVQNKLHYAANGKTAAEIITERANADKPFMGLMTFSRNGIVKSDVVIAKNYLTKEEIKRLNNIVSAYFDIAELKALDKTPMKMEDYIKQLDKLIISMDRKILKHSGKVSHLYATKKAITEYTKYQIKHLSNVEQDYLYSINALIKRTNSVKKSK